MNFMVANLQSINTESSESYKKFEKDFPIIVSRQVDWGEMDAFGHVNNIIYFRYFENARMAHFKETGIFPEPSTDDKNRERVGPILADIGCRYKRPLLFPDLAYVGCRVDSFESHGFMMTQAVFSKSSDFVVAEGPARIIAYDYTALKKTALPQCWVDEITRLQPTLSV